MQREYLILMQGEKSCGAVKIEQCSEGLLAEISVDSALVLPENCVFRAYLVMPEKKETRYLGVLEDHTGSFALENTAAPVGIVLTLRNTGTGREEFCCLCAEEGKLAEMRGCFENAGKKETAGEERKEQSVENVGKITPAAAFEKEYVKTAIQKLKAMFEDFSFEKVNGYFMRQNSRIIEYILRDGTVPECIAEQGCYYFAVKNGENEFLIAVPAKEESPFDECAEYAFEIRSEGCRGEKLFCVIAGQDSEGEYFRRRKI